eukprot:g6994.t1
MEKIKKIGKYIIVDPLGCGGFSTVYRCREEDSKKIYALKVGNMCIKKEYTEKQQVIDDMTHMEEWRAYKALSFGKGESNDHGIPEVFETGIAQLPSGSLRPYLVMQLLGKSLLSLASDSSISKERVLSLSHSMLETLQHVHSVGFIHRDIKPSNFCFQKRGTKKIYLLDFGFAREKPDVNDEMHDDFVGTPDYASTAALQGKRQGAGDDLESLAYTILEIWSGELPWNLTSSHSLQGEWTQRNLTSMSHKREVKWNSLIKHGRIPSFLEEWVAYCKELKFHEDPDYDYLHSLLTQETNQRQRDQRVKRKGLSESETSSDPDSSSPYKRLCLDAEE